MMEESKSCNLEIMVLWKDDIMIALRIKLKCLHVSEGLCVEKREEMAARSWGVM
jgi:hypothetical protein